MELITNLVDVAEKVIVSYRQTHQCICRYTLCMTDGLLLDKSVLKKIKQWQNAMGQNNIHDPHKALLDLKTLQF